MYADWQGYNRLLPNIEYPAHPSVDHTELARPPAPALHVLLWMHGTISGMVNCMSPGHLCPSALPSICAAIFSVNQGLQGWAACIHRNCCLLHLQIEQPWGDLCYQYVQRSVSRSKVGPCMAALSAEERIEDKLRDNLGSIRGKSNLSLKDRS